MRLSLQQFGPHGAPDGPSAGDWLPGIDILHGAEGAQAGWSHRFTAIVAAHLAPHLLTPSLLGRARPGIRQDGRRMRC